MNKFKFSQRIGLVFGLLFGSLMRNTTALTYPPLAFLIPFKFGSYPTIIKLLLIALLVVPMVCYSVSAWSANGTIIISEIKPKHSNHCLDVNLLTGNVYQHACHSGDNQKFWLMEAGDGDYQIKAKHSNQCLDVNLVTGNIYQYPCHDGDNQKFKLVSAGDDYYEIKPKHSDQCLDIHLDTDNAYQHACHGGDNQKFHIDKSSSFPAVVSTIQPKYSGDCLDISYGTGNAYQHACHGGDNQKFWLINMGNGHHEIRVKYSNQCLDISHTSNAYQHACHGGDNQRFKLVSAGDDYYEIKPKHSNQCLEIHLDTGNAYQHACHGGDNQKFKVQIYQSVTYEYDKLSRLTKVVIPHRQLEINYVYDAMGNRLVRHTDTINQQRSPGSHSLSMLQPTDLRAAPFDDLTLEWDHHAPQGWRGHYSVYFGDSNPPNLYKSGLTEKTLHIGPLDYTHFLQIKAIDQWGDAHSSTVWAISPSDADSDGIPDHIENKLCTDVQNPDTDSDGLLDGDEDKPIFGVISDGETDPCNPDTDGDLIPDGWERDNGLDPLDPSDATSDTDGDGFTALEEYVSGDDPNSFDSAPVGIEFDFEGKNLPESLSWIREDNQSWELDQSDPLQGEQSLKSSGALGNYESSVIRTHVMSTGGIVRFDLKRSPGYYYDKLEFYLDGERLRYWGNTSNSVPQTTLVFDLPAGAHELKWRYYKYYNDSSRSQVAWIDRLFISAQADSDGDYVIDSWELRYFSHLDEDLSLDADEDGLTHLQEYQAKTAPDTADTDGDLIPDGWELDNGLDPLDNSDYTGDIDGNGQSNLLDYLLTIATESAAADSDEDRMSDLWELNNRLDPLDASDAASDNDQDGFVALEEYMFSTDPNQSDSVPGIKIFFVGDSLPESLPWIHKGDQPWELDQSNPIQGQQSLKSGPITHNQSSSLKTQVQVTSDGGFVLFGLKVSSDSFDKLGFFLDGELLQEWSGETRLLSPPFYLPPGSHELMWRYSKDDSVNRGKDAAWINFLLILNNLEDSDKDGVLDAWELGIFGSLDTDLSLDSDNDGLTHLQEYQYQTSPDLPDSDVDSILDGLEVQHKTDPNNPDSDGDLITDGWEVNNGLKPLDGSDASGDIDNDGQSNFVEYVLSIPTKSTNMDSDEDGMSDLWEAQNDLNPLDASDAASDNDGDGFSALQEYESGTDPNQYGSAPTSIGLNRSIDIKDNKTTIIDQPLISAAPIISKDSAVSYKVADKSDRHTMDNLLYAGVSGVQQQNYLQYSPYLNIDIAGVLGFSQLERYHQNLNHLHRQLINYQPTN